MIEWISIFRSENTTLDHVSCLQVTPTPFSVFPGSTSRGLANEKEQKLPTRSLPHYGILRSAQQDPHTGTAGQAIPSQDSCRRRWSLLQMILVARHRVGQEEKIRRKDLALPAWVESNTTKWLLLQMMTKSSSASYSRVHGKFEAL